MPRHVVRRTRPVPTVRFATDTSPPPETPSSWSVTSTPSRSGGHTTRSLAYASNVDTRRDRLLKRQPGVVRKLLQLRRIAGSDFEFVLCVSCRDPRSPLAGYNCISSSSEGTSLETLALWTRRLKIDAKRKDKNRQFVSFGPTLDPNQVPATLFSFPHRALFPDPEARGCREGDSDGEEMLDKVDREEEEKSGSALLLDRTPPAMSDHFLSPRDFAGGREDMFDRFRSGAPTVVTIPPVDVIASVVSVRHPARTLPVETKSDSESGSPSSESEPYSPESLKLDALETFTPIDLPQPPPFEAPLRRVQEPVEARKILRDLVEFLGGR